MLLKYSFFSGVETTHCLVEAILLQTNEAAHVLALSAAVNRFLNLVSHAGMNMFNLTKYYDAAKMLSIPRWIVDVRHDTAHGQMPSYDILKAAVTFCFHWLMINYWDCEDQTMIQDESHNEEFIHDLLDCYKYLKIFSIWGNKTLSELKDQKEIHNQLLSFITNLRSAPSNGEPPRKKKRKAMNFDEIAIHDNAVYLRNQIEKIIRNKNKQEIQAVITCLCHDQLLIPDEELVKSLKEGKDDEFLPKNLIKVWSDVLAMISQNGLLTELLTSLINLDCDDKFSSKVANAWVTRLLSQMNQSTNGLLKISSSDQNRDKINEFVTQSILSCNENLSLHLDKLGQIHDPPLTKSQLSKIEKLTHIVHGDVSATDTEHEIKTVDDLNVNSSSCSIWSKVRFDDVCLGQGNLVFSSEGAKVDAPEWLNEPPENVIAIDWACLLQNKS